MARILNLILGPHRFATESPWGILTGICAIFGAVILSLVATVFGGVVLTFAGPDASATCLSGGIMLEAKGCAGWLLGLVGASSVVLIGAFWAISYARKGSTPANALLIRPSGLHWWQYVLLVGCMIAMVLISQNLVALISGATDAELEVGINYLKEAITGAGWLNWLLVVCVVVVAGPLIEEIIFRGFIFTMLIKTRAGFIGAAVITSACWTVLHYQYTWHVLIVLFAFGIALAYVVWRTGSLWPGVVVHAANNLASALILAFR